MADVFEPGVFQSGVFEMSGQAGWRDLLELSGVWTAESFAQVKKTVVETGAGVDTVTTTHAVFPVLTAGSVVDIPRITVPLTIPETGAVSVAHSIAVQATHIISGTGAASVNLAVNVVVNDSGTGGDTPAFSANIPLTIPDTATAVDAINASTAVAVVDVSTAVGLIRVASQLSALTVGTTQIALLIAVAACVQDAGGGAETAATKQIARPVADISTGAWSAVG